MEKIQKMLNTKVQVLSLGLESFTDALNKQSVGVTHIDWKPAAGGDKKMQAMLSLLKRKK